MPLPARPQASSGTHRDAFLAAIVEDEAARKVISPPRWTNDLNRFNRPFWYLSKNPRFHTWEVANSPGALIRHGVFAAERMNLRVSDLNRDEMESALAELADQLNARIVKAKIYLVGGTAMVLAFDARFTTGDIDGALHPTDDVLAVAAEIGERRGLGPEWLNNSAARFIPVFKEPNWQPIFKSGNVEIVAADERAMLAMKMRAGRGFRDRPDINFLVKRCGITSFAEALELYEEFFPEDPLPGRAFPLLDEAIAALGP